MRNQKPFREGKHVSPIEGSQWTPWYTALVPNAPNNSRNYEPREQGDDGVIYSPIRTRFRGRSYDDGIYELGVSKGNRRYVVYIGSAHRKGPGSMNERILEYCTGGSQKDEFINRAMRLGYKLSVRVQNIRGSLKHVRECEDRYLERYNYAWNQRNNGRIRENIPPYRR